MSLFVFEQNPIWFNAVVLASAAALIWLAGTRLSRYADAIADRTGLGQAFIGAVLLGGITSLPEVATTLTASIGGNAPLAVNNVLGGVAMQVTILALADAAIRGPSLSSRVGSSVVFLQGLLLMLLLGVTVAAITAGSFVVLGVDAWTAMIFVLAGGGLYVAKRHEADPRWQPVRAHANPPGIVDRSEEMSSPTEGTPTRRIALYTVASGAGVIIAGYFATRSAEALAGQTGLGAGFVGLIFLAVTTSLPEVSTTLGAVRLARYRLAFSNIFGTNVFDVALLFLSDVTFRGAGVLDEVGAFSQFGAVLGLVLTTVYLIGIMRRRSRTVMRMGLDSVVVLLVYLAGVAILYTMR